MKKYSLLYSTFGVLILLGILHFLASIFYWYWSVPYFDKLVHFLAGISVGFLSLWVWWESGFFGRATPTARQAFITSLLFVILIGATWEVFELVNGIANPAYGETYAQDTFLDLLADVVGAIVAGLVGRRASFYLHE